MFAGPRDDDDMQPPLPKVEAIKAPYKVGKHWDSGAARTESQRDPI